MFLYKNNIHYKKPNDQILTNNHIKKQHLYTKDNGKLILDKGSFSFLQLRS